MLRGFTFYNDDGVPRWEPVGFCDSRFLRTMMLKAWNPKADFEMLKQIRREAIEESGFEAVPDGTR